MNKVFKIKQSIYPYKFKLAFFISETDVKNILKKVKIEKADYNTFLNGTGWCTRFFNDIGGSIILINKNKCKTYDYFIKVIRHEIQHASADCFEYICAEDNDLKKEPFLYLNDFLFSKCLKIGKKEYE